MKNRDFFGAIESMTKEAYIEDSNLVKELLESSISRVFHSKYDPDAELELIIDAPKKNIQLFNKSLNVVSDSDSNFEPSVEIKLKDAKKINKDAKVGNVVTGLMDWMIFTRTDVRQIFQLFKQGIREKKKNYIYDNYKDLKDKIVNAKLIGLTSNYAIFEVNGIKAFMPPKLMNRNLQMTINENYNVYVEDVLEESKDAQIIVSNSSVEVIKKAFAEEVPEIADGTIEIVKIAREAGIRSKVAVKSNNPNVDSIGSCIGDNGSRINAIVNKLGGEKIDIVRYSDNLIEYICSASSPSKVIGVNIIDDAYVQVIVPNKQYTLAIGKKGTNARLLSNLISMKVDLFSIDKAMDNDIHFEWNGNLRQDEVERIEAGERFTNRNNKSNNRFTMQDEQFDNEVQLFEENITSEFENNFNTPNIDFSDEDIAKMEAEFNLEE